MPKAIKTVFFDIGGVLLHIHPERTLQYWSERGHISREDVEKHFPMNSHHEYEKGRLTDQDFYNAVRKNIPGAHELSEQDFWTGWRMLVGEETGAAQFINTIVNDVPVWLLSNTNSHHIMFESGRFSFMNSVAGSIFSYEVGARKPEPEIFDQAVLRTGCDPETALFIDDVQANVDQARQMGFQTIHFRTVGKLKKQLTEAGLNIA